MTNRRGLLNVFMMTAVALLLMAGGCREVNDTLWLQYQPIGSGGWPQGKTMVFEPEPADSAWLGAPVRLGLCIRYRASRPLPPIPLMIELEDETGELAVDTLTIPLFSRDGKPLDAQSFGIAEHTATIVNNLPLRRGLAVCLVPLAPDSATKGLLDIGIKLSANHGTDTPAP